MTRRIIFRPEAEKELAEATDWYEARGKGLGGDFLRALDAVLSVVHRHPAGFPIVFGHARRAVLRRFPYSLIYLVSDDEIVIAACIHSRRYPHRWQARL
jgi:plasmid stabilization system protein ParE